MGHIEELIEVDVSVRTAYEQWTLFEEFPRFMAGVKEVVQLADRKLQWRGEAGGRPVEWVAFIAEQEPDQRIAWRNLSGPGSNGSVSFESVAAVKTRLTLRIEAAPSVAAPGAGDLDRFKKFIEAREGLPARADHRPRHCES